MRRISKQRLNVRGFSLVEMLIVVGIIVILAGAFALGVNDVMNPAAREAEGTPIYGMPILNVDEAPEVIICNYDLRPGYAGVENPLYSRSQGLRLLLGDAKESLEILIGEL